MTEVKRTHPFHPWGKRGGRGDAHHQNYDVTSQTCHSLCIVEHSLSACFSTFKVSSSPSSPKFPLLLSLVHQPSYIFNIYRQNSLNHKNHQISKMSQKIMFADCFTLSLQHSQTVYTHTRMPTEMFCIKIIIQQKNVLPYKLINKNELPYEYK